MEIALLIAGGRDADAVGTEAPSALDRLARQHIDEFRAGVRVPREACARLKADELDGLPT